MSLATLARPGQNSDIRTKRWIFNKGAITWGNQMLKGSVPCDLLVVDEVGPLELERGEGWTEAIPTVRSGLFKLALVAVRPELLDAARAIFPEARSMKANPISSDFDLTALSDPR